MLFYYMQYVNIQLLATSSGQYDRALDLWEESKMSGSMDTDSYTIVMAMCERLGSSEAALALREDMRSQGLAMEDRYY